MKAFAGEIAILCDTTCQIPDTDPPFPPRNGAQNPPKSAQGNPRSRDRARGGIVPALRTIEAPSGHLQVIFNRHLRPARAYASGHLGFGAPFPDGVT